MAPTTNSIPAGAQAIGQNNGQTFFVGGNSSIAAGNAAPKTSTPAPTQGAGGILYQNTDQSNAAVQSRTNPNLPGADLAAFYKANPGQAFTAEDYAHYLSAGKTPVISTADPSYTAVNSLGQSISTAQNNPINVPGVLTNPGMTNNGYDNTAAKEASDAYVANIQARQKELKEEQDAEVARISGDYTQQEGDLEQTQKAETGTTSRNLAYLQQGGTSASAQAYLNGLEKTHASEVTTLLAKRDNAIAVAQNAYADKRFQLADEQMKEAKDLESTIYSRNQDYLNNTLKIKEDQRAQQEFDQKTQDTAKQFALDNDISQQFYDVGGIVYRTSDGKAFGDAQSFVAAGGDPSYKNVFVVEPGSKEAKAYVQDLAGKYPDAGISLKDDPTTAQSKIKSSAIYREQVRPPKSSGETVSLNDQVSVASNQDITGLVQHWQQAGYLNSGYIGSDQYKTAKGQFVSKYAGLMTDPSKTFDSAMSVYVNPYNQKTTGGGFLGGAGKTTQTPNANVKNDYGIN